MSRGYPKLVLFCAAIALAYVLFDNPNVQEQLWSLGELQYVGIFLAGMFFSYGFTTPFAVGFFVTVQPSNLLFAALVGGTGAMLSDWMIFHFVKLSLMDEFRRLARGARWLKVLVHSAIPYHLRSFFLYVIAGLIIASPLPDEFAVTLLAGLTRINSPGFTLLSWIMNTAGIYVMLAFF